MSAPLAGVTAFIEVFDSHGSISSALFDVLTSLGAEILRRWKPTVTHVIWRKGSKTSYARAIEHSQVLVTPQWIYACEQENCMVDTAAYRPRNPALETSLKRKRTPVASSSKQRKFKSNSVTMKPKQITLTEDSPLIKHELDLKKVEILKLYPQGLKEQQLFDLKTAINEFGRAELAESVLCCHVMIVDKEAETLELAYAVTAGLAVVRVTWVMVSQLLKGWQDPRVFSQCYLKPNPKLFGLRSFSSTLQDQFQNTLCKHIVRNLGGIWTVPTEADFLLEAVAESRGSYEVGWLVSNVMRGVFKAEVLT